MGKCPLEPSSSAAESCEWVVENSVPDGITLWQPWMQTAFTVRQAVSDTRPDVRAALTLQGVWSANVGLENRTVAVGGPNQPESHKPAAAICCVGRK